MSKMQRDKGARTEREIVNLHRNLGVRAERVPLSGASRYQGNGADVDVYAFGPDEAPLVAEVKARAARFELIRFDDVSVNTGRNYLVKGLIPREGLTVVWGAPKCGKSFWVFDLAMHVALGWPYRRRKVTQGAVIYVAAEGESGFRVRIEAFRREKLAEASAGTPFYLLPSRLDIVAEGATLVEDIRAALGPIAPAAVVIDTLNRTISGSESDDRDMAEYIKALDSIRAAFGCAVIIVHHCGVDDRRPRGHTSLTAAADAQIVVKRDQKNTITTTVQWMKDGPEGDTTASRLKVIPVGVDLDGDEITSCVVEESFAQAASPKARLSPRERQALDCLLNCISDHGQLAPGGQHYPAGTQVVTLDLWRRATMLAGVVDPDAANPRQDFRRLRIKLQDRAIIRAWGDFVWPVATPAAGT